MRYFFDIYEHGQPDFIDAMGAIFSSLDDAKAEAVRRHSSRMIECSHRGCITPALTLGLRDETGRVVSQAVTHLSWTDRPPGQ